MKLANRCALVTGSSRGIGAAIATAFAREGAQVVINFVKAEKRALQVLNEIESFGGRAIIVQADISKEEDIDRMVREANKVFGKIDILVNNAAALYSNRPFLQTAWEEMLPEIKVALKGTYQCCRAVIPGMMERRWGRIINIGASTQVHPHFKIYGYWIGKAGMLALARTLALEFGPHGITVNSVFPGGVDTEIHRLQPESSLSGPQSEVMAGIVLEKQAIKKSVQPSDVAAAALYFASDDASLATGCVLHISGGMIITPA